jgi:glycosyltransferase involved in cell wall biosynthesis
MSAPFISICIPAYKRIHYLKRLLDSIEIQSFRDFEVILSDDSDDQSVQELIQPYLSKFSISYYQNQPSLGTPANWNYGISKAKGTWIKLIHDDDWFASADSLTQFAAATKQGNKFIFSAYANFIETSKTLQPVLFPENAKNKIIKSPLLLLSENLIGPPSVTLFHRSITAQYDERMKWRVDLEYYIRIIQQEHHFTYINRPLIHVGVSESQVTNSCLNIPEVEIPEAHILLQKFGTSPLKNIKVYDAYWRILRNSKINSTQILQSYGQQDWSKAIVNMVRMQSHFSFMALKNGFVSKSLMLVSYCINFFQSNL